MRGSLEFFVPFFGAEDGGFSGYLGFRSPIRINTNFKEVNHG